MAKSAKFCLLVYGALSVLSSHALAIDLQPNDIVAPTPDRTAISISYVNAQNTTLYVNNVPTGASPNLESNLGIVRLGHTYTIGSLPAVSYVQVGGGTLSPDGSLSAYPASQGMTDTTLQQQFGPMQTIRRALILASQPIYPCLLASIPRPKPSILAAIATARHCSLVISGP